MLQGEQSHKSVQAKHDPMIDEYSNDWTLGTPNMDLWLPGFKRHPSKSQPAHQSLSPQDDKGFQSHLLGSPAQW